MRYDLSPREAADLLDVSHDTVKRWAREGLLPGYQTPGGWWRFNEQQIRKWKAKRVKAAS
jgi:excisionase family DNA binding protein